MIQRKRINGVDVSYVVANPAFDLIFAAHKTGATVKEIGQAEGATIAANINFADTRRGIPIGRLIVKGKVVSADIAKTTARDELYMLPDGSLHIGKAPAGALWAMQSSPRILKDGKSFTQESIERDQLDSSAWAGKAYRLAVGLTAARELVVARTHTKIDMDALEGVMLALGCVDALNGDGGGSAYLWPSDSGWGRKMGAALCIEEERKNDMTNPFKLIGDDKPELVIDFGHGGSDPGASNSAKGIVEKRITMSAGLKVAKRLRDHGVKLALTRDSDITLIPEHRTDLVKNSGAKYCLSIHVNAGGGDGAEVIHSIHNDGKLANAIASAIEEAGQNVRRVFCRAHPNNPKLDYYYMHRETGDVATQIVELFFLDSKATGPDSDLNEYKAEMDDWIEAIVRAYCQFTGREYTSPNTSEPEAPIDDLSGHWSEAAMREAIKDGVFGGFPDGTFRPDEPLTRAQYAVLRLREKEVK